MSKVPDAALRKLIAAELPSLRDVRHDLHAHPQLRYEETYASGVVTEELKRLGVSFETGIAKTGVVAWISPNHTKHHRRSAGASTSRPVLALRADMDALPIEEETGLAYASRNAGCMHACGHDGHTTMLLGVARVLMRLRQALPAPVKLFFQPAEEGGAGAAKLIAGGALDRRIGGLRVGRVLGIHGSPEMNLGTVGTMPGVLMAASDLFTITLTGRGGHGAAPHLTVDPIIAGAHLVTALQTIVSRNIDPLMPAVLSVCRVHAGQAQNVIPDTIVLAGTIRSLDEDVASTIHRHMREVVTKTARAFGCTWDIELHNICPPTINDPGFTDQVLAHCRRSFGERGVVQLTKPRMGAEDFSYYARRVPACFVFLGLHPRGGAPSPGLHTPRFDFNDRALPIGIQLMCGMALAE